MKMIGVFASFFVGISREAAGMVSEDPQLLSGPDHGATCLLHYLCVRRPSPCQTIATGIGRR